MIFNPPITASWSLKKICGVKEKLYTWILKERYNINEVYLSYFEDYPKVTWTHFVWYRASLPRWKFILWLALLRKLKTKDKLFRLKLSPHDMCAMCNSATESIEHIFFYGPFSAECLRRLCLWLDLPNLHLSLYTMIRHNWKRNGFQKKVLISNFCRLCYHIWRTRNEAIWLFQMSTVDRVMERIGHETRTRLCSLYPIKSQTYVWFRDEI